MLAPYKQEVARSSRAPPIFAGSFLKRRIAGRLLLLAHSDSEAHETATTFGCAATTACASGKRSSVPYADA